MIVDFHTHIFPPAVAADRARYVATDPAFAAMYADPKATLASADDLLVSMERAAIDVSVALGFAWQDAALPMGELKRRAEAVIPPGDYDYTTEISLAAEGLVRTISGSGSPASCTSWRIR